jgi:hypothetical protein
MAILSRLPLQQQIIWMAVIVTGIGFYWLHLEVLAAVVFTSGLMLLFLFLVIRVFFTDTSPPEDSPCRGRSRKITRRSRLHQAAPDDDDDAD